MLDTSTDELARLVHTLHETQQRIQALTGGSVDAVVDAASGSAYLLPASQAYLRRSEFEQRCFAAERASILNALPAHIALLDAQGHVVAVNETWRRFATANACRSSDFAVGQNYLDVCDRATGNCATEAIAVAAGIRAVIDRGAASFEIEYPCHSPTEQRWFHLIVTPLNNGDVEGAVVMHIDVTGRKLAEQALRASEERFRLLSKATNDAILDWDLDTDALWWNDSFAALCGFTHETADPAIDAWAQRIHPDDVAVIMSGVDHALAGHAEYWSGEYRFLCHDGAYAYVLHRGHVIRDPFGKPVRMIGGMTDLTERRRTEQRVVEQAALLTAEGEKHRILFDRAADGIAIVTDDGRVADANSRFLAMLQATSDQILGSHVWEWDTAFADQTEWNRLGRSVTQAPLLQTQIRRRDGSAFDAEVVWSAADLPDGRMLYCNVRDISDRRKTEQELALYRSHLEHLVHERTSALEEANRRLQVSEERYAYAAEATSDGIWDCDLRTGETTFSPSYFSMLGHTPDGFASHISTWFDLLHLDDRELVTTFGTERLEKTGSYEAEFRLRSRDGSYRWILSRGKVVEWNADGKPARIVGTHTDLTNRKLVEAQLREARDEAEAANRAKSAFLAMMSHEIRTPLNGVIGMAEVLAQDQLQQRQADAVRIIRDLALNLMTLIDDILDFSKIEAGSLGLDQTSVSVTELIEDICASLEPMALAEGVELSAIIAPQCPEWLLADPTRLRQILFNVAGNAIKFSGGQTAKRGRVTIRVDVAQAAPLQLCIRVTDNGIGMTAETQSRLYTPFTQGETSTTRRYGGTGLGLAITRRLIDMFQGTIEVDSAPGAGTTFTMVLPFEIVANRRAAVRLDLSGINCVLAWSADVPEAADLQGYLAAAGARTHIAADLPQAMALARTLTDTIVIHDATPGRAPAGDKGSRSASATARQLLLWRGQRWRAFLGPGDDIGLDLGWMRQDALLRAVAIATGRMPQDALATNSPVPTPFGAKPPPTVAEARAQGRLILLADDDEINRTVILRQLNLLGYTAETASDGWEALEKWRSGSYALLLTDVFMPNMDGYQLATAIRQEEAGGRRIPIVALSANAVRGEADKARALGVDVYLTKPILLKDLRKALQHFLPDPVSPAAVPDETPMDPDLGGEMPVFDPDTLVSLVGQDPKILSDVLSDFSRAAKQLAADLTAAVADGDAARMGAVAHKLKSSSRSVGALQLGEICATLEEAGRTGAFAAIPICMAQFAAAMAEVQAHILNHLDQTRRSTLPGAGPNANVDH